jgi:hypothetical protein
MIALMKQLVLAGGLLLVSQHTLAAISWTNCSNKDRNLIRTEQEIWGANSIEWKRNSTVLKDVREFFDAKTKNTLSNTEVKDDSYGKGTREIYTINVVLKEKHDDKIIEESDVRCSTLTYPKIYD